MDSLLEQQVVEAVVDHQVLQEVEEGRHQGVEEVRHQGVEEGRHQEVEEVHQERQGAQGLSLGSRLHSEV